MPSESVKTKCLTAIAGILIFSMSAGCTPQSESLSPSSILISTETRSHQTLSPSIITGSNFPLTSVIELTEQSPTQEPLPLPTPIPALRPGQQITLTAIKMINENNGWGVVSDGHAVYTQDGGLTWRDASPSDNKALYFFLDAERAWAYPYGIDPCSEGMGCYPYHFMMDTGLIWRTADGGKSWKAGKPFDLEVVGMVPVKLQFVDPQTGWFLYISRFGMSSITDTTLIRSDDAGETWQDQGPATEMCKPTGMIYSDKNTGWFSVDCRSVGAIDGLPLEEFLTGKEVPGLQQITTGGVKWNYITLPAPDTYPPISDFPTDNQGNPPVVRCGVEQLHLITTTAFYLNWGCSLGYSNRTFFSYGYLTDDGGQTWHSWPSTGNEYFLDELTGWRMLIIDPGESNSIQQTIDGGKSWVTIHTVSWEKATFDFVSEPTSWAIVSIGEVSALLYTNNGGKTWQELHPIVVN